MSARHGYVIFMSMPFALCISCLRFCSTHHYKLLTTGGEPAAILLSPHLHLVRGGSITLGGANSICRNPSKRFGFASAHFIFPDMVG